MDLRCQYNTNAANIAIDNVENLLALNIILNIKKGINSKQYLLKVNGFVKYIKTIIRLRSKLVTPKAFRPCPKSTKAKLFSCIIEAFNCSLDLNKYKIEKRTINIDSIFISFAFLIAIIREA